MRIGYFWPTRNKDLIDHDSYAAREFFHELIENNQIIFNNQKVKPYHYFHLSNFHKFNKDAKNSSINFFQFAIKIINEPEILSQINKFYSGWEKHTESYKSAVFIINNFDSAGKVKHAEYPLALKNKRDELIKINSLEV